MKRTLKHPLRYALLLTGLAAGCVGQEEPTGGEPVMAGAGDKWYMPVSGRENTWLALESHWTGGFGGNAHNEYTLYYVRGHGWWQDDERFKLGYWPIGTSAWEGGPELRRINTDTIAVDTPQRNGKVLTVKYALAGPWPN